MCIHTNTHIEYVNVFIVYILEELLIWYTRIIY